MTPLERAARDRLGAFLGARPLMAQWTGRPEDFGDVITSAWLDATENAPGASLYESDLRLLLAALDRHETIADADHQAAQHVRAEYETRRHGTGQCEECGCCVASGCHTGPGSTCPTDRLGDSVCPCTGD